MQQLILGGARSGKSRLAEQLASTGNSEVVYVATASVPDDDTEMLQRIQQHRLRRPSEWLLVEEPIQLADVLREYQKPGRCILVDCLTLWLSNLLLVDEGRHFDTQREALFSTLSELKGELIMVGNEVGMGIVPMGALSRRFQDESGWLQQRLAAQVDRVILTVAGLPMTLKGEKL